MATVARFLKGPDDKSRANTVEYLRLAECMIVDKDNGDAKNIGADGFPICLAEEDDGMEYSEKFKEIGAAAQGILLGNNATNGTGLPPIADVQKRQLLLTIRCMVVHGAFLGGNFGLHKPDSAGRWPAGTSSVLEWIKQENPTLMVSLLPSEGSMGVTPIGGGRDVSTSLVSLAPN